MQEIGYNFAARCNFNLDLDIDLGINSNVRPLSPFAFGQQQQRGMVRMIRAGQSLVVVAANYY